MVTDKPKTDKTSRSLFHPISPTIGQFVKTLVFTAENLAPLIAFLVLSHFYGLKIAIAGTVAYSVIDIVRRLWFKQDIPKLYWVSAGMTVGFGTIDLFAETPIMLRFESVISNCVTAGIFFAGAGGKVSMMQEIVEKKRGEPFRNRPDLRRFFAYMTLAWAIYFLVKAMVYLGAGLLLPLDALMEIRLVFGNVSLGLMILLTATQGRRLYWFLHARGLLPERPAEAATAEEREG